MSFLHPQLLWLLLVPAALLLASLRPRRTIAAAYPKIPHATFRQSSLVTGSTFLPPRPAAVLLALACLVLALARPQGATLSTPVITESRDVLVAVDVSRSMLADDIAPSRLARARLLVDNLADELRGERLGLMPFAGTAFLQSPLSADYEIFRTFLDELGPDMIPAGGSDFTALLNAAEEAFGPSASESPDNLPSADRFLFILSDGEAENDTWIPAAEKLAARGVRVLALGLGTANGAMIPDGKGGLVKDPEGAVVLTRLDAKTLQDLARITGGTYRDASSWVDLPALLRETIARGRANRVTTDHAPRRVELFAWFLAPALALLAFAVVREFPVTPRQRTPRVSIPTLPTRYAASLALLLALAVSLPAAEDALPPPDPLVELVAKLATAATIAPADLARLASLTAEQGEKARAAQDAAPVPEGALRDALAATTQGLATAPSAADWAGLRSRLEILLAPLPEQPKSDQPQEENKEDADPSDAESDSSESGESQNSKANPDAKPSSPSESEGSPSSDSKNAGQPEPSSDTGSSNGSDSASAPPPPGASAQALGDLAQKPDTPESAVPTPGEEEPPPDEPTQRAGGVSASGRPEGSEAADDAALDPSLAIPQQRLDRVRDADSPARLFKLLQDAETPPDSDRRATGTPTRDW